jgi:type I restriction enzyme R subunit
MTEFKQIIGRGTRVKEDCGKVFFTILDFAASATVRFADPDFDGDPIDEEVVQIDEEGEEVPVDGDPPEPAPDDDEPGIIIDPPAEPRRKIVYTGGSVEIVADLVHELDADGKQLRVVQYTDYTGQRVRTLYPDADALHEQWADPARRQAIVDMLAERGIDFDDLARAVNQPDADPFDVLCNLAYHTPVRTRRDRASAVKKLRQSFFDKYGPEARLVLSDLLDKYAEHGATQIKLPDILKLPPFSNFGNVAEIAATFGGPDALRQAVTELQTLIYAA